MRTLAFQQVKFGYSKGQQVFDGLSFDIQQPPGKGFVTGIMGMSGTGKTTILKLLLGIEKNYQGTISVGPGNPVISYVPQEPVLFEHLTPLRNAEYFKHVNHYNKRFDEALFQELAQTLQIMDVLKLARSVNEISGGQRQRISLLRAMCINPDILLLDEPMTGLDEEVKDEFLRTLTLLIQKFQLLALYVTHHRKEAEFVSDSILYLSKEKSTGPVTQAIFQNASSFFETPPQVAAFNAIKKLTENLLYFTLGAGGQIIPAKSTAEEKAGLEMMSFDEQVINFSAQEGFEFEALARTGCYTILQLKQFPVTLTISSALLESGRNTPYILLNGNINLYNSKGFFSRKAVIINNKIIN